MKLIIFLFLITLILTLVGCSGNIPAISKYIQASLNAEALHPPKTAVIVPLFGTVSESWASEVEKALQNSDNDLVVLWIESPGGSVITTKLLTHKLKVFQTKYNKPIYVYSEKVLASGAYWVAAAFEKIILSPTGGAGSIGVYTIRADYSKLYDSSGIKHNFIASDSTKIMGHILNPMKDWERKYIQRRINAAHIAFMKHIWDYRSSQLIDAYKIRNLRDVITRQDTILVMYQFRQISNGIFYGANTASSAGLIDGIMYFDEFVEFLKLDGYKAVTIDGKIIVDFYPTEEDK